LAALANHPEALRKIFLTDHVNIAGIYALNLTVNGELKTIIVDDYVPVD